MFAASPTATSRASSKRPDLGMSRRAPRAAQPLPGLLRAHLSGVELLALFLDAVYLKTRPRGQNEGVGYTFAGERALVAVEHDRRRCRSTV